MNSVSTAKVAAIITESQVALNAGSNEGVQVGDEVTLYKVVQVADPETKEPLGTVAVPKLELRVEHVQEKLSVASVTEEYDADDVPSGPMNKILFGRGMLYKRVTTNRGDVNRRTVFVKVGEEARIVHLSEESSAED